MIQKIEPFELSMPKIAWAIAIGLIGCLFMSCVDIPRSEIFIIALVCCLLVGADFFEKQRDGRIPRESKTIALMINSLGLGISLGCLIFAPGFCWKFLSLVLMAITASSIVSLYFVIEGVND
jgi:hypothetical protein